MADYVARDYATLRQAFIDYLDDNPAVSAVWTDYVPGNVGIVFLELLAFLGAHLERSLDFRAAEMYLTTARLKESVWRIAKSFGYPVSGPASYSFTTDLDVFDAEGSSPPYAVDVVVPAQLITVGGKKWYYPGEEILLAGDTSLELTLSQGDVTEEIFAGDGNAYQPYTLGAEKIAEASIEVRALGELWSRYDSISQASEDEYAYEVIRSESGDTIVQFGNSTRGFIPPSGASINIRYIVTEGSSGAGNKDAFDGEEFSWFSTELGKDMTAELTVDPAHSHPSGGTDGPTIDGIQSNLLPWLRNVDVGVTAEAIRAQVLSHSSPSLGVVTHATPTLSLSDTEANVVIIYVATSITDYTLGLASAGLKASLLEYLNERKIISVEYTMADPTITVQNIALQVGTAINVDRTALQATIEAAIQGLFLVGNINIGQTIYLSKLYEAVEAITGVDWCLFTAPATNLSPGSDEVYTLGTITITWA